MYAEMQNVLSPQEDEEVVYSGSFNFTKTPYYQLRAKSDGGIGIRVSFGYSMVILQDIQPLINYANGIKGGSTGCYKIPYDQSMLNFLIDSNGYFCVSDMKIIHLTHGSEIVKYDAYDESSISFIAVICTKNTGRSILMVNNCNNQHSMNEGYCLLLRSSYVFNVLTQIVGKSTYLIVKVSSTDKFSDVWKESLKKNKELDKMHHDRCIVEDYNVTCSSNREKKIYNCVESLVTNSILMEDLKGKLLVFKQISSNIEHLFQFNNNNLLNDFIKKSSDVITSEMENMVKSSDQITECLKKMESDKQVIRDILLKASLSSEVISEVLSVIPTQSSEKLKLFADNQRFMCSHYKNILTNNNINTEINYQSIEQTYMFNLYKVYGQNEIMISYLTSIIERVKLVIDSITQELSVLDESFKSKLDALIIKRLAKK